MNAIATSLYALINDNITVSRSGGNVDVGLHFGLAKPGTEYPYITYIPTDENPLLLHDQKPISETNWDFKIWSSDVEEIGTIFEELVKLFNAHDLDTANIGMVRGQGLPIMTEDNQPNEIVYSRIIECMVYIKDSD